MIRLPVEIVHIIKMIEDAGFEAYAVGGCVRDSILGRKPEDWDLTSNASRDTLEALFPGAAIVNKKLGVMRITEGEVTADIAAYRIDGEYKDYRRPETVIFTTEITEDLRRRDFTMNAVAVSPGRGIVDPYNGIGDIEKKLIRGIGDPGVRFEEDALRILRAVRFAAQLDFMIDVGTLRAMKEKANLLEHISVERIREEFTKTILSGQGGKGLRLYLETGVMPYILGHECMEDASETERNQLALLAVTIDHAESDPGYRLALVYQCFEEGRANCAIERLGYSNEMKKRLKYAVGLRGELERIRDKEALKRFIAGIGMENYRYLARLAEQRRRVYSLDDTPFLHRTELFDAIMKDREPIFIEDLAVDGNDLLEAGIAEGVGIGWTLSLLLDTVHRYPEKNRKDLLMKIAAERQLEK